MTRPAHPAGTYVALYGSVGEDWRRRARALLDAANIPCHDPTDPRWRGITHENGDQHQELIDQLVAEEHDGLLGAGCVIFHLVGGPEAPPSLAARFELGLLAGRGIATFVHVDPDAPGRNYIWAAIKRHPHLVRCDSVEDAARQAISHITRNV
ncbi:nucleoside 2-deoxyribosyltransferase domain-containing protein [Vitiosangium sp. GDMCC 1.1324]|uniref:nucleoside 2-deoxyribosyltransferase domain-containing protein n=1 Tax=Vitiosangium sp. (strain GDMCC 1.1324) TaxID=2138576 RepID=UPI000D3BC9CA|nr:nucleoside 2-deoxyribosyltransferase domain-containing protein [Vitiosangium sp. GDMCC 1.1324]PTL85910.1 hypothetical protein DAT35_04265 [Vitiosangium sp. GDMCC 1.1324]